MEKPTQQTQPALMHQYSTDDEKALNEAVYAAETEFCKIYGKRRAIDFITARHQEANAIVYEGGAAFTELKYALVAITEYDRERGCPPYRIVALRDIPDRNVKFGDRGGYVSGHHNLSHKYDCWIHDDGWVTGTATVEHFAVVAHHALVKGNAEISGEAIVAEYSTVTDDALVCDQAVVKGYARIADQAQATGHSTLKDSATLRDNAAIYDVEVGGNTTLTKDMVIKANQIQLDKGGTYNDLDDTDVGNMSILPLVMHSQRCTESTKTGRQCMNTVKPNAKVCSAGHRQKHLAVRIPRLRDLDAESKPAST